MANDTPLIQCPSCGQSMKWSAEQPYRPFCSARCRLIDLGDWLSESHSIPGEPASPETLMDSFSDGEKDF